jgi:uncharacterized protein with NRDE domain
VARGKERLAHLVERGDFSPEDLLAILADSRPAPDAELPSTGVTLEMERLLSPIFIASPRYGTRASTVIVVDHRRRGTYVERSFGPEGGLGTKTEILEFAAS